MQPDVKKDLIIVYDGQCPLCSAYVRMIRLKDAFASVTLVDARDTAAPLADILMHKKYDLDAGMIVRIGDSIYHGDAAINILAVTTTRATWFNKLCGILFSNPTVAKLLYPFCRAGRRIALFVKGVGLIGEK